MSDMNNLWVALSMIVSLFLMVKHPLSLVLLLIFFTLVTMMSFLLFLNLSWLSMILFLVFLGGLLVIFTYLSALVPNEMYFFNPLWLTLMMSPFLSIRFDLNGSLNYYQKSLMMEVLNTNSTSSILMFLIYLLVALLTAMVMAQQLKSPLSQTSH